ncbi:hypothetical protein [Bifidobacterium samirii]|uniref:Uncharacterized protein n=1 Tax=Bifidobacterium samirii TaxID=2306974 RepID=A0A430FUU3_9BIFI|nr:hypothetical protein [Bifidobacterium samirii]RSX57227.1 hypothetical protein D2E24_0820 [Bifidobacterium samirii]
MERQTAGPTPDFVGYEYTSVKVGDALRSMVADAYHNFGWTPTDGSRRGVLEFRRDRNLLNRAELTRLQRQFDAHLRELETLNRAPARKSSIVGWSVGLAGCVFLGGATFAYLGGLMMLMVILAVPGFLCWFGAHPIAKWVRRIVAERSEPAIDHLYDVNYDVCRRANSLLLRDGGISVAAGGTSGRDAGNGTSE